MKLSFFIQVLLIPDTADASDVSVGSTILGPFDNTNRMYCFNTTALADGYFEGNQTFSYSLTLIGEETRVIISPNVTMVTILDNTTLTIGFDPIQYAVNESDAYVTLGVSILGGASIQGTSVEVMFSTKDGTALAGQDYIQTTQLLTFNQSTTNIPVSMGIINNGYYEDDIIFQTNLALQSAAGYEQFVTLSPAMATATIIDDINGVTIGFGQTGYSFFENQRYARVTVSVLLGQLKKSVVIQFRTIRGSAVGPDDYAETDIILVFNASTPNITVDIPLVDDGLAEDDESFSAELLAVTPSGLVTIAPATTGITIIDTNSVAIGFEKQNYQVSKHQGHIPLKIQVLRGTLGRTVLLHVKTKDSSAIASKNYISIDYDLPAMNLSVYELTVDVSILVNELAQDDKVFSVDLSLISPSSRVIIAPISAQVTIIDDNNVTIGFEKQSYQVLKHQGSIPLKIQVLEGTLGRTVLLHVKTRDGSAIASANYISIDYHLPAMNLSVYELTVDVSIVVNELAEDDKVFSVEVSLISPSSRIIIVPTSAQVTIIDDNNVTFGFEQQGYSTLESNGHVTLKVKVLKGMLGRTVNLLLSTSDVSATAPADYTSVSNYPLVLSQSVPEATLDVSIATDNLVEYNETFMASLSLAVPNNRFSISPSGAIVMIVNDDTAIIGFNETLYDVYNTDMTVRIQLSVISGVLGRSVRLRFATRSNTAIAGMDYSSVTTTVTFDPAHMSIFVDVPITLRDAYQDSRSFDGTLTLTDSIPEGFTVDPDTATVTIDDNHNVTIGFMQTNYILRESAGNVTLAVMLLDGKLGQNIAIDLNTIDDASSMGRYVPISGRSLSFSPTSSVQYVTVFINNNGTGSPFSVQLSSTLPRVILAPGIARVAILNDNSVTVGFEHDSYVVYENASFLSVFVVLNGTVQHPVTVAFNTSDGSATMQTDYLRVSQALTFAPNSQITEVRVPIIYDPSEERSEMFFVNLSATDTNINFSIMRAAVTILDTNVVTIKFSQPTILVQQTSGNGTLCVIRTGSIDRDVSVKLSGALQSDFGSIDRTLVISLNDNMTCVNFPVVNDKTALRPVVTLNFTIELVDTSDPNVVIDPTADEALVLIIDDEKLGVALENGTTVLESVGMIMSCINFDKDFADSFNISVVSNGSTATAGDDFLSVHRTLVAKPGDKTICTQLQVMNDNVVEGLESFDVTMSIVDANPLINVLNDRATYYIIDDDPLDIGFDQPVYSVNEGAVLVLNVSIHSDTVLARPVTVSLDTIDGSAAAGNDYTPLKGYNLEFTNSTRTIPVNVTTLYNGIVEVLQVFQVALSTSDQAVLFDQQSADVEIADVDEITFSFESASYNVSEKDGRVHVTLTIVGGTLQRDLTVSVQTTPGSARANSDYTPLTRSFTFSAATSNVTFTVDILADNTIEDTQAFSVVMLTSDRAVTNTGLSTTIYILDNDQVTIGFDQAVYSYSVNGGDTSAVVTVSVHSGVMFERSVKVLLSTYDQNATSGIDYDALVSLELEFNNDTSIHPVHINIKDNGIVEGLLVFQVALSTSDQAVIFDQPSADVEIADVDKITLEFLPSVYNVRESDSNVTVTVVITNGTLNRDVVVTVQTIQGTAAESTDYIPLTRTLTFSASVANQTFTIDILDDNTVESTETFAVVLQSSDPAVNLGTSASIRIFDSTQATVGFEFSQYLVPKGLSLIVAIVLSPSNIILDRSVSVTVQSFDNTALASKNYVSVGPQTLTFTQGNRVNNINLTTINNNIVEGTKDLSLALTSSDLAVVLSPSSAVVKITDISTIRVAFEYPSYTASESLGSVTVCAVVLGKLQRPVTVLLNTSGVTATQTNSAPQQGVLQFLYDYLAENATFVFNETTTKLCVLITFLEDYAYEADETLRVSLSSSDPSVEITTPTAEVTIEDSTVIGIGFVNLPHVVRENGIMIQVCTELKDTVNFQTTAAVNFSTVPGSAIPMLNYVPTTARLEFSQINKRLCVPVSILDDGVITNTLSFTATLSALSPRENINSISTTVIIQNTDKITIGFSTNQYTTPEGSTLQIQVTTQSNTVLGIPVTVNISSSDITALASKNYVSVGLQTLTFTQGNRVNNINLTTINNSIVEGTKDLSLALTSSDPAVVLSPSSAVVKITDIDIVVLEPINGSQTVTTDGPNATICYGITSGNLGKDVTFNVKTIDGSAVAQKDYIPINIQMVFNASGSLNPCVAVQLINTTVYKNPTNFSVIITTTDGSVVIKNGIVPVVINNSAVLTIGFDQINYNVVEGTDQSVTLCAKVLAGTLGTNITASVSTQPGSALDGQDYTGSNGSSGVTLQLSPSQLQSCFSVVIIDDAILEDPIEVFTALLITSAPRVTVQPNMATVSIRDNDYVNITSEDTVLADEGEALVTLQLVGVLGRNVTVVLYTVDQTATAPDNYHSTNVTMTFVPNGPTQQTVSIYVVNDMVSRDPLTFVAVVISTDPAVRVITQRILVTIPNNNTVTIGFTKSLYTVSEQEGVVTLCTTVTNGILGRHVTITMATSDGTALDGSDYQSTTSVLHFVPGVTTACGNVSIINDQTLESKETLSAQLTTGDSRVILNPFTTNVDIIDDDTVNISFTQPAYYYYTTNTTGYIVIQKTGNSDIQVTVLVTAPPSAQPNPSVGVISGTITFPPGGNTVQSVSFSITNPGIALKGVETYNVSLSNPSQGGVLAQTSVVIMDTNMVMVQFEKPSYSVYENNTAGLVVCVTKDKVTAVPVMVTIVSSPITAVEGTNYVAVSTTVTMATTSTRECFTVTELDNHIALDPTLTFALSLTATPTSVVASSLRSIVTILDTNVVTVTMVQTNYSVAEGQSVSVCAVKDVTTARRLNVSLNTQGITATDGQDFTGGSSVLLFDATPQNTKCVVIATLPDQSIEVPETFVVNLLPGSDYSVGNPSTSSVTINEALNVEMANDTVVGDPLFSVPLYTPLTHLFGAIQPALCYEVHGRDNVYFNLISDGGVSVNAHYQNISENLNVIDQIGIRAVDSKGSISNIRVDLTGCASSINGTTTTLYQADGILLRKYSDRVRVSVPNCGRNSIQLVMWVMCQNNQLMDPVTGNTLTIAMIKFVVARGLNLSPQSHGLIGQFWNVPVDVSNYTGPLRAGSSIAYPRYTISVAHPLSPARSFTGIKYTYNWEFEKGVCLYAGNRQAGPIYEVESPNDPVIEGSYTNYIMSDAFATDFAYTRFSPKCGAP